MFPETKNDPARGAKSLVSIAITRLVCRDLWKPIRRIRFGQCAMNRARMPETSIDENREFDAREDDIRTTAQADDGREVDTIAHAFRVQDSTHDQLARGVTASIGHHGSADTLV